MKLIQFIRAFWVLSSLILLALLVVQTLKIKHYYKPNELILTQKQIIDSSIKRFNSTDTYSSFEMVSEDSYCSHGYYPVLKYSESYATEFCKCGDDIIRDNCSSVDKEIAHVKKCHPIPSSTYNYNFPLKNNTSNEPYTSVKLCAKRVDTTKISWFEENHYNSYSQSGQNSYYQYCPFSDSYKQGLIKNTLECPQSKAEFKCRPEGEKKCESRFLIYCTGVYEDCTQSAFDKCAHDEIGCFSKTSSFCIKNTEQCPITDMKLIKGSERIPQGYEVSNMKFPSNYKLVVQRSSFTENYINDITFAGDNGYRTEGSTRIEGIESIKLEEFMNINNMAKLNYRNYQNEIMHIYLVRSYMWRYYSSQYTEPLSKEKIQEYNEKIYSTYDLIYNSRMICIQLLLVKLIFELCRCFKTYKIEESDDSLGRVMDKVNLRFYFLLEILMLVLILTVFTKRLSFTSWKIEDQLRDLDRHQNWRDAHNVNRIGALTIVAIVFFGVTKLVALILLLIKKCRDRKKQRGNKIQKSPLSDQQQQEQLHNQNQQVVEIKYVQMQ